MKPLYIRYKTLVDLGACEERLEFKRRFGNKVLVTVTTAVANANRFNWWWIAESTLTRENYDAMRERVREFNGDTNTCTCLECDPNQNKLQFIARAFAEAYLAQGGRTKREGGIDAEL